MSAQVDRRRWRVGELASATGLTVRTLHHYDRLGLLQPGERTSSGHRLYVAADVGRLYRIVALRRLGLGLAEIGALLDGNAALGAIVERQLEAVARETMALRQLHDRLIAIRDALEREQEPSLDQLIDAMEATTMHEKYFTPDQLEQLDARGTEIGADGMARVGEQWAEIFATLRAEQAAGTDPADPRLDRVRTSAKELVSQFTGGDAGVAGSLNEMWANEDPAEVSRGMVDRELWDYYRRVCASGA